MKVFGELEPVECKLVESLWRVSVSAEAFLRPVVRLKRPEIDDEEAPLDCTEGARTEPLRLGAKKGVSHLRIGSRSSTHFGEDEDDLDQQWEREDSPEELLCCRIAQTNSGEVADIRRR